MLPWAIYYWSCYVYICITKIFTFIILLTFVKLFICFIFSVHFKVSKCKKDPENQMLIKKFIAWNIEKENRKAPDKPIVVLFDMTGAGISNMVC